MLNRAIQIAFLTFAATLVASPGPYVHCHDGQNELFTDLRQADVTTDDNLGIVSGVNGTIHAGWRALGAAAYQQFDSQWYATVVNGPTVNLLLQDTAGKKYLGVRLENGLSSAKGILSNEPVDAMSSFDWPMTCDVQP